MYIVHVCGYTCALLERCSEIISASLIDLTDIHVE
jgi:hypothetical protein